MSVGSAYLLSRSFLAASGASLSEIGTTYWQGDFCIFGAKWGLVQSTCRQRADAARGLLLLVASVLLQVVALCISNLGLAFRLNAVVALVLAALVAGVAFVVACATSGHGALSYMRRCVLAQVMHPSFAGWRKRVLSPDGRDGLNEEVRNLFSGLARPAKIEALSGTFYDSVVELAQQEGHQPMPQRGQSDAADAGHV
jgi:hypothetical protein